MYLEEGVWHYHHDIHIYVCMCVCSKKAHTYESMFIIQYEHVPGERVLLLRSPLYICMYVRVDVGKIAYIYEREYRTLYKIGSWRSEFGIGIPLYMCTYVYVYVEIMRTKI